MIKYRLVAGRRRGNGGMEGQAVLRGGGWQWRVVSGESCYGRRGEMRWLRQVVSAPPHQKCCSALSRR